MNNVKITLAILLSTLLIDQTYAEVFRCEENGKVIYSGTPCGSNAKKIDISPSPIVGGYARDKERRRSFLAKNKDIKPIYKSAIEAGVVIPGMTEEQTLASLGEPTKRNLSQGVNHSTWQWIYESSTGHRRYIYLENGIVTGSN